MKSIFRAVRTKLLVEGKLVRYLAYAIGEIALIIVGILFALQINEWNEDRKAQAEFDQYVAQLTEDVRSAIENMDRSMETVDAFATRVAGIIDYLESESPSDEQFELFEMGLERLCKYSEPQLRVGLLERLLDGDNEIIGRHRELHRKALEMESRVEQRLSNLEHIYNQIDHLIVPTSSYFGPESESKGVYRSYDAEHLRRSPEFAYLVKTNLDRLVVLKMFTQMLKEHLEAFLEGLQSYA